MGRPSIDPELMIRPLAVGYVFAIRSERLICREVQVNGIAPHIPVAEISACFVAISDCVVAASAARLVAFAADFAASGGKGPCDKDNSYPFSKSLSSTFALFFFAVGVTFIPYGINESRELNRLTVAMLSPLPSLQMPLSFRVVRGNVRHASHPFLSALLGRNELDAIIFKRAAIQSVLCPRIPCTAVDRFCDSVALVA